MFAKFSAAEATITNLVMGAAYPQGLAVDSSGKPLYVADHDNDRHCHGYACSTQDRQHGGGHLYRGSSQSVCAPQVSRAMADPSCQRYFRLTLRRAAVDSAGNVYVADTGNRRIRKISTSGQTRIVNTIAGNGNDSYSGDDEGRADKAQLGGPSGAGFDATGNLYFADSKNDRISEESRSTAQLQLSRVTELLVFRETEDPPSMLN